MYPGSLLCNLVSIFITKHTYIPYMTHQISVSVLYPLHEYSEVKPLFKSGNSLDIANYRPISLLVSFSKIIEKLIHQRLLPII